MAYVDFGNPYLRAFFPRWLADHKRKLDAVRLALPAWAAQARAAEAEAARRDGRSARPLAAVYDIDEVLLCNVHLNGFSAPAGTQGPSAVDFHAADFFTGEAGEPWGRQEELNPILPGALELVRATSGLGLQPFFVSGRLEPLRGETVANFVRVGLAAPGEGPGVRAADLERRGPAEILTLCPPEARPPPGGSVRPYKEGRRREIEKTHRIVVNVGDQASDLGLYGDYHYCLPHPFYTIP